MSEKPEFRTCHECGHCESQQGRDGKCYQNVDPGEYGEDCGCRCYYWDDEDEDDEGGAA